MKRKIDWKGVNGKLHTITIDTGRPAPIRPRQEAPLDDLDRLFARQQTRVENTLNARLASYDARRSRVLHTSRGDQMTTKLNRQETDIERRH